MRCFYWINCFNLVEFDGPFKTAAEAKREAIKTMERVQNGFAFDIEIVETMATGYIKKGKWYNGRFKETEKEKKERLANAN